LYLNATDSVCGMWVIEFKKRIKLDSVLIADSALYSQENLKIIEGLSWITRVPLTIKITRELIQNASIELIENLEDKEPEERELIVKLQKKGYKWKEEMVTYGGIKQRWLIVESESRKESDLQKLEQKIKEEEEKARKILKKLEKEELDNPSESHERLNQINKNLKLLSIGETRIIEKESPDNKKIYKLERKTEEIEKKRQEAGRFILATNILDE
jgi:transposase